jgi:nicotinamide-nucleotide amidase
MKTLSAEIVAIGSELVLGQLVDTNTPYLASQLHELGIEVAYQTMVGDDRARMRSVIRQVLRRSDILITTGGIGPTEDDLTREVIAEVTSKRLVFHPKLFALIKGFFDLAGFVMAPNNRKQALIPAGARVIPNWQGTAPGFLLKTETGKIIVTLPGVPREMKRMYQETVKPYLLKQLGRQKGWIEYQVLKVCGLGESRVDQQIGDLIRGSSNPVIGLLASPGEIRIRLTARGKNSQETRKVIGAMEERIRQRLGPLIFGQGDETLEGVAVEGLARHRASLGLVETFTGGRLSQRLKATGSPWFKGGLILGAESDGPFPGLRELSSQTKAVYLADQVRALLKTELGLAVVVEEQEGNQWLYLGLSGGKPETYAHKIGGFSETLPDRVTVMALDWLRKRLMEKGSGK